MKEIVELYINGGKIYFEEQPQFFLNYQHTDLHNPTVVKNQFSKTISIEGTPENNRIFNCFYDMKRMNSGELFNPSRKETFVIYRNGEIVDTGYVKLDRVLKNSSKVTYEVTLYGGLGQFLYNLQYNEAGEQLKLSDLDYGVDLNMIINKKTIKDAWLYITDVNKEVENGELYDFINFAPCYNGIPDEFTTDKVAVDLQSFRLNNPRLYEQFKLPEDTDSSFTTVNGWITADLAKEYDEWTTKDLRSYLQRPVVRFKNIIQACCNPQNNGGYEVDLDTEFFSENNPYYEDAWMTLPLVRQMESTENSSLFTIDGDNIIIPTNTEGYIKLSVNATLMAQADTSALPNTPDFLWTGILRRGTGNAGGVITQQYNRAYTIQLVIYDKDNNVVSTSPCTAFYTNLSNTTDFDFSPEADAQVNSITGQFDRQLDGKYVFNGGGYNISTGTFKYENGMYGKIFIKTSTIKKIGDYGDNVLFTNWGVKPWDVPISLSIGYSNETIESKGELGYYLTKQKLFNTEKTPCEYFLTYLKTFNLHIYKDRLENKMYIRQRKNYFSGEIKDIEGLVDVKDNVKITPLTFSTKWLELSNESVKTSLTEKYKQEYGVDFGVQKIDTNYNFDTSTKILIDNNAFKTTQQVRGKSKYYIDIYQQFEDDDVYYPPYMLDGLQPVFYAANGDTAEGEYISTKSRETAINWWTDKYYDFLPKPLFADAENKPQEGENVLLFYNGRVDTRDESGKRLDFQITDDIPEFEQLNGSEPCWIWSMDWDIVENTLNYFPCFSRYKTNNNGIVTHSWDFGTPRIVYMPEITVDADSSIYNQYWKSYIADQYDVNTRKVECYVLLRQLTVDEWLKDFYYWDGRYWLLNKIVDFNPTSNGKTKCEFVLINNINNYI